MDKNFNKNIEFVAKRYHRGSFSEKQAWRRMGIAKQTIWRISLARIAAAIAVLVVVGATAALLLQRQPEPTPHAETIETVQTQSTISRDAVHVLDFDDAPLTEVIAEIESTYGVTVGNVPDDAAMQRLSLHFEGNADELIEMINDILDTNMTI